MNRSRTASLAMVPIALLGSLASAMRCSAQEAKPATAAVAPKPAARAAGARDDTPALQASPAGMLRFPGGKVKIGANRKEMMEFIATTDLGRMANAQVGIENEYSLSCPEHTIVLPSFWIGIYEVTNAQWHRFLESAAKTTYTVPPEGSPGARTLDDIARLFLIDQVYNRAGGGKFYPTAVSWKGLYELNEETINPSVGADGKPVDPATRPKADLFQKVALRPGMKLTCYRWTVPMHWTVDGKLRGAPPAGRESQPVTGVSLCDAMAFAQYYGRHVPTETEWEAVARGPKGEYFPEGPWNPLGHAWKFFNGELEKAKEAARKSLPAATKKLEEAEKSGSATTLAAARAEVERLRWVLAAKELPDFTQSTAPPVVEVGMFPYGRSPCGAHDMLGNAEEWTSTMLAPYEGTDSRSTWVGARAQVLRGGNTFDKEALIVSIFRKFLAENSPIHRTYRNNAVGFRVARYEAPGASAALRAVFRLRAVEPPVLPRETDPKTHLDVGPDLDLYGAVGVELLQDAAWDAALAPQSDPAGKVFFTGPARSVCIVPATGTPFKDAAGLKKAAESAAPPAEGAKRTSDKRTPRDIPFLGLLHISDGLDVKGLVRTEVLKKVPLTEAEKAAWISNWKAQKAAEAAKKEAEEKAGDGEAPPPENKMVPGDDKGDKGKKGDKKKGGKKDEPKKEEPATDAPAKEGEGEAEEEEEPEEDAPMAVPTEKEVLVVERKPGFVKGADQPNGLLLGFQKHDGALRPVLWEARPGIVGSTATGGIVLLEEPLVVLGEKDIEFKRVSKAMSPWSKFERVSGETTLVFYVPVEDAKGPAIEVTLKLTLGEIPAGEWLTQAIK